MKLSLKKIDIIKLFTSLKKLKTTENHLKTAINASFLSFKKIIGLETQYILLFFVKYLPLVQYLRNTKNNYKNS